MYSAKHFRVRMDPRSEGLWVVVSHPATGRELAEGPMESGSVKPVVQRLTRRIQGTLVDPREIRVEVGFSPDGQVMRVVHLPTGRARSRCTSEGRHGLKEELLDELVAELWEAGLLSQPGFG